MANVQCQMCNASLHKWCRRQHSWLHRFTVLPQFRQVAASVPHPDIGEVPAKLVGAAPAPEDLAVVCAGSCVGARYNHTAG